MKTFYPLLIRNHKGETLYFSEYRIFPRPLGSNESLQELDLDEFRIFFKSDSLRCHEFFECGDFVRFYF